MAIEIIERRGWFAKPQTRVLKPAAAEETILDGLLGTATIKAGASPEIFTLCSYLRLGRIHMKTGEITISGEDINRHGGAISRAVNNSDGISNLGGHRVALKWTPTPQSEQPKK